MSSNRSFLDHCYDLKTHDDVRSFYETRAGEYDAVVVDEIGYVAPQISVARFAEFVGDPASTVIDLGCGTGLVGTALRARGFLEIDGADYSESMLALAREKGCYRSLFTVDLNSAGTLPHRSYDAAISVGAFGEAHIEAWAIGHVAEVVRPGGVLCVCLNERCIEAQGFHATFESLVDGGAASFLSVTDEPYHRNAGIRGRVYVFRVN